VKYAPKKLFKRRDENYYERERERVANKDTDEDLFKNSLKLFILDYSNN